MKAIAKSTRELGRKLANMDGKYKGMSQTEGEKAARWIVDLMAAEIILKRTSMLELLVSKAHKKANLYWKNIEKQKKIMAKGKK